MKRIVKLAASLLVLVLLASTSFGQEIQGLTVKSLGEKVNLEYSISGEQLGQVFSITPSYSTDGGKTYNAIKTVVGQYGNNVLGGKNQIIIWDVLKDLPALQSDVTFKIAGVTKASKPLIEEFSKIDFKLISLHKMPNNQIELVLSITNNGAQRDLKLINGLITISDFKKNKLDAQRGKLGDVLGGQRYSTPQKTLKSNETVQATFTFDYVPSDFDRAMRLNVGAEILTFSQFGLDKLETSVLQFRDLPISDKPTTLMATDVTKKFESTASASLNIQKPKPAELADITPPVITIIFPESVKLLGSEATRGRPYAQSSQGLDDKRLRSVGGATDGITVSEKTLTVKGTATDESGLFDVVINGQSAQISSDGNNFAAEVMLKVGRNDIVVRAMDTRKNSVEKRFIVYRKDTPNQKAFSDTEELDIVFDAPKAPKFYAFIVGVNEYPDPNISSLANPVSDAQKLYNVLTQKYTFDPNDIVFIKNATRAQLIDEFDRFTRRVGKNDNLLVFYAGHGYWDPETEFGYWLPSDALARSTSNWMANSQIKDYVAAIKSKHTLIIADACFSGGIFKNRKAFSDATDQLNKAYDKPSRKAMTSGNLTEVPDQSMFIKYLVQRLEENTLGYISAEELFSSFKQSVMNSTSAEPQYGDIKDTGDQGGDFIFVKK